MRSRYAAAAALVVCLHGVAAVGQSRPAVPVMIGGEEAAEGCGGTAVVTVATGSRLNLRSGPGTSHAIVERLRSGQTVSVCERRDKGWVGIIVHRTGKDRRDCGLSDAGPRRKAYAGPCAAGWVLERYLRIAAG